MDLMLDKLEVKQLEVVTRKIDTARANLKEWEAQKKRLRDRARARARLAQKKEAQ